MSDEVLGFDTNHPRYKELKAEFSKITKKKQDAYTDKLDVIAEKKAKKLLAEG